MVIDQTTITYLLGLTSIVGIIFAVYNSFRNPQINSDQKAIKLEDRIASLEKAVLEIKETHLRTVENDIKNLTQAVNELGKTVIKLSTIIDERIPKGSPNLTPPGI